MSQSNNNQSQTTEAQDQTEFSLEVSQGKARLELSISSQQAQKLLHAAGLLISHLLAASLGSSVNLDASLLNHIHRDLPSVSAPLPLQRSDIQQ
jgi:hypothetical protein